MRSTPPPSGLGLIQGTAVGTTPAREQPEVAPGLLLKLEALKVTGSVQAARRDECGFGLTAGEAAARVVVFNLVRDIAGPFERCTVAGATGPVVPTPILGSLTAGRWMSAMQADAESPEDECGSVDGPRRQPCDPTGHSGGQPQNGEPTRRDIDGAQGRN